MSAKTMVLTQFRVQKLPENLQIDLPGFSCALRWVDIDYRLLDRYIRQAFEPSVKSLLGYTDENRPSNPVTDVVDVEGMRFRVTTSPTTKRPSYSKVVSNFEAYLSSLAEQYERGLLGAGYRTLARKDRGKELYIALSVLLDKLKSELAGSMEGKEGIQQGIELDPTEDSVPDVITVVNDRDYSARRKPNARTYAGAVRLMSYNNSSVSKFKALLKEDATHMLGGEPENVVAIYYKFDSATFTHQLEPRDSVAYRELVEAFLKPAPKRLTVKSRIGDFPMLQTAFSGGEAMLREKGLLTDEFLADYDPQLRDDNWYVRLAGASSRLAKHTAEKTSLQIEQNIFMLPSAQPL